MTLELSYDPARNRRVPMRRRTLAALVSTIIALAGCSVDTDTAPTTGQAEPTASQPDNGATGTGGGPDAGTDTGADTQAPERSDNSVNNDGRTLTDAIDAAVDGQATDTPDTGTEPGTGAALPVTTEQPTAPVLRPVTPVAPAPAEPTTTSGESESPFEVVAPEPAEEQSAPSAEPQPSPAEEPAGEVDAEPADAQAGEEPNETPDNSDAQPDVSAGNDTGTPPSPESAPEPSAEPAPEPEAEPSPEPLSEAPPPAAAPTDNDSDNDNDSSTDESSSTLGERFESANTAGFTGEVLDDGGIRVTWPEDTTARGYNLYRQGNYLLTVFDTTYVDEDTTDGSFYYEVQAFDFDENYQYIARGLTVKVRGSGRENPQRRSGPGVDLSDYDLVFSDEFNDGALDLGKWDTSYIWGDDVIINSEEQHYVDLQNEPDFGFDPFTFDDGALVINSIPTPDSLAGKANDQPYLSGVITSYDAFKFTYGYVEARARVPFGKGLWAAFWLLNADYGDPDPADPEIDIMEHIGDNQDVAFHTYHYFDEDDKLRSTPSHPVKGIDFTADFHTFAVDWRPGVIVFYIDGIETKRIIDPNVSSQEMYVIANTALGGWWPGSPDATTQFPARYAIDYIRVYQKRTSYDDAPLFNDRAPPIPFADDSGLEIPYSDDPTQQSPNHRPPFDLFPGGDPRF